jgi:hypothetical protein
MVPQFHESENDKILINMKTVNYRFNARRSVVLSLCETAPQ